MVLLFQIWTLALKVVLVHPANLMETVSVTVTLMMCTGGIGHTLSSCLVGCGTQDEAEDEAEVCVLCCQKRSTVAVCDECKEHYCTECIDTHTCGTNVMMQLYCSRYLNNAYRFYWRSMRLCYPNPPFSQLAF